MKNLDFLGWTKRVLTNKREDLSNKEWRFYDQGNHEEAEKAFRKRSNRQRRVLGSDHIDTLDTMQMLADTLANLRRHDEAEKLYRDVLDHRKRVLGPDHIDTLKTMNSLAFTLNNLRRYDKSEQMYRDVLDHRKYVLGPDHIDTLCTMHNLADTLNGLQQYDKAEQMFRDVLDRQKRELGPDHADTLKTMHSLALTLNNLQQNDKSEEMYRDVLDRRKRVLGLDHADTLRTMHNLAITLSKLQRYEEAETMFRDAFDRLKRVLGPDHINTLHTMYNLAFTLNNLQRYDKSEQMYRDVLDRRKRVLGPDHIDTLHTMHNLALALNKLHRYDEAKTMKQDVLDRRKRVLGPDHIDILNTKRELEILLAVRPPLSFDFESLHTALCANGQALPVSSSAQSRDWTPWITKAHVLGCGAFGDVHYADWTGLPSHLPTPPPVVLKTVRSGIVKSNRLKFLKREIAILARVKHANIVPFVGVWYDGDMPALVSVFMEKGDVKAYISNHPQVDRAKLNFEIALGLRYLHNHILKIIHGDLKAANVLVNSKGQACITDFGLSMIVADGSLWITSASQARGTTRWMAPELLNNTQPTVHMPSDVYAYAMTSLEIATGSHPFQHILQDAAVAVAVAVKKERPLRPNGLVSDANWNLWEECWSENPADRPLMSKVVKRLKGRV